MPDPFAILTGDPAFDPREPITVNGYKFIPAAEHDRRVTELLEANNRELEMRRTAIRIATPHLSPAEIARIKGEIA